MSVVTANLNKISDELYLITDEYVEIKILILPD
jgi:hypothetical protein